MSINKSILLALGVSLPWLGIVAQAQGLREITNITFSQRGDNLQLVLETGGSPLEQPIVVREGNVLIAEFKGAKLKIPQGKDYRLTDPVAGIKNLVVSEEKGTIRLAIEGTEAVPTIVFQTTGTSLVAQIKPEFLDEITLTVEGKVASDLDKPQISTSISREAFRLRNNPRLGDILEQLPGVVLAGPPGEAKDVRLRGLDKEFTRTDVNGVTIPDGGEKREFRSDRIPSFFIDKVTILRNPTAEFESDGIAGRVNVTTRPIPDRFILEAEGAGGTARVGTPWRIEGGIGDRVSQDFGYLAGLSFVSQPFLILKDKVFTNGNRELEEENKDKFFIDARTDLKFFYDKGNITVNPLLSIQLEDKFKTKTNTQPGRPTSREIETEEKKIQTIGLGVTNEHRFDSGVLWESRLGTYTNKELKDKLKDNFRQNAQQSFIFDRKEVEIETKEDRILDFATAFTIPVTTGLKQEIKTGGAIRLRSRFRDKTKDDVRSDGTIRDLTVPKDNYSITENYFAAFVQSKIELSDRFSITPGVRVEHVPRTTLDGTNRTGSRTDTDVNPSLHLLWQPAETISIKGAVSRSLNRPKFDELSPFVEERNDRFVLGNPDLRPARSWNFDIGGNWSTKDFFLGLNYFYRGIDDVIEESLASTGNRINNKQVFQVLNVGSGSLSGVELEQRFNLGFASNAQNKLTLWSNQTFISSNLNDFLGRSRPFKEQPNFVGNVGLDYTYEPWGTTFTIAFGYISDSIDFRADRTTKILEASTTLNLGLRQRIAKNFSLFFEANNLTNTQKIEIERDVNNRQTTRKVEDVGPSYLVGLSMQF